MANWLNVNRAKLVRYWRSERIRAPTSARGTCVRVSATLDHHTPGRGAQHEATGPEQRRGPRSLDGQHRERFGAVRVTEEDLDWILDDAGERQGRARWARATPGTG